MMQEQKMMNKILAVVILFLIIFQSCTSDCVKNEKGIAFGYYTSNSFDDVIQLKKNGTYLHFLIKENFSESGTWKLNNCNLILNNFTQIYDWGSGEAVYIKNTQSYYMHKKIFYVADEAFGYSFIEKYSGKSKKERENN